VKGWRSIFQANRTQKQTGVAILYLKKQTSKLARKHKEGQFILIKRAIHQEDTTKANIFIEYQHIQFLKANTTSHKKQR
jgi:hypothetical protein